MSQQYYDAFDLALYNRLSGDSTLTAIVGTRIFNTWAQAVAEGAMPSVLYRRDTVQARTDAFNKRITAYAFYIDVFVEVYPTGGDAYDGLAVGRSIIDRVQGPWPSSVTYGLDRWTPDITATGYAADAIALTEDWQENHDEGVYRWTVPCSCLVSI